MLCELRQITEAIKRPQTPQPPLAFELVEKRYRDLWRCGNREEVEALLGPPSQRNVSEPELREIEESLWNMGRNWFPSVRVWDKWSDPKDAGRWVAVLYYAEDSTVNKVYVKLKKGF
jgi:hypothetical protein